MILPTRDTPSRPAAQMLKTILLLAGSFTFAFLLGELVHDFGHYLCHLAYDNTQVQVHFDPFGGTHISGANDLPVKVLGVTSAAGPLFNLALALISFLLLWRKRKPILIPFLIWGPVALIQEGVTFSLGLLTPGGDTAWIVKLGVPQAVILVAGILLLVAGLAGIALLLSLAGLQVEDSPPRKFAILLVSMCALMFVRFVHSMLVAPDYLLENLIPLVFSLLLALFVALLHRPVTRVAGKIPGNHAAPLPWTVPLSALALGLSMFAVQLFILG